MDAFRKMDVEITYTYRSEKGVGLPVSISPKETSQKRYKQARVDNSFATPTSCNFDSNEINEKRNHRSHHRRYHQR